VMVEAWSMRSLGSVSMCRSIMLWRLSMSCHLKVTKQSYLKGVALTY